MKSKAPLRSLAVALLLLITAACQDHHYVPYDADDPLDPAAFGKGLEDEARINGSDPAPTTSAADGAGLIASGRIILTPGAEKLAQPGWTLYIIARSAAGGPPMAAKRIAAPHFPLSFTLTVADAMMGPPEQGATFIVTARLDADGDPMTKGESDLVGRAAKEESLGAEGVTVTLAPAGS